MSSPGDLGAIRVLWRQPDTLALWGIPYHMRPGQSPTDLWRGRRRRDFTAEARGWHGATVPDPGPRVGWIWLGQPGWWGSMPRDRQAEVTAFLEPLGSAGLIPGNPYEWTVLEEAGTERA